MTAGEYCLVNKLRGHMRKADGTYRKVSMYGSVVDFNFATKQVDSVDPDPVYWSSSSGRWNYTTTGSGFYATDDPGPPGHAFAKGDEAAVRFNIGLYGLASCADCKARNSVALAVCAMRGIGLVVSATTHGEEDREYGDCHPGARYGSNVADGP